MKAIHLNLAARPYRDERPFIAVVVVGSLLIAFLTLMNFGAWFDYRNGTRSTRDKIASLDRQAEQERDRTRTLEQKLKAVDVKMLAAQAEFANARLAERAFSWSELLDRLEKVLPDDVHVSSINPSFDKNGLVHLTLVCLAKDGNGLVTTLNRMNQTTYFTGPFPNGEEHAPDGYHFAISVDYHPSIARVVP